MTVAAIAVGLFLGTFMCAYLPSLLNVNKNIINLISIFGTGSILGACIIVVLPESAAILINAQYEINRLTGINSATMTGAEHAMHESLSLDSNHIEIVPQSVMKTVGGTIMAGFLLMLLLDEGVSIYRDC